MSQRSAVLLICVSLSMYGVGTECDTDMIDT